MNHYLPNREIAPDILSLIVSFRRPEYTVAAMIADGFTHLQGTCSKCRSIVLNPFRMLLETRSINRETTLGQISRAYRCKKCGGRETKGGLLQPAYQYMGTAADTDAESPVNRRRSGSA